MPALINAHTHLEFSDLERPIGERGQRFGDWIASVVEHRRSKLLRNGADSLKQEQSSAIQRGLLESSQTGIALLGEIATDGGPGVSVAGVGGVRFLELLGLARDRQAVQLQRAQEFVDQQPLEGWRVGLSPHAPYTVTPEMVQQICALASRHGAPVAMHLSESLDELELLQSHSGALVEVLRALDAWLPTAIPRGICSRDYLEILSRAPRALVIHGNYFGERDWEFLAQHSTRMSVIYCPRTFRYFHSGGYPLETMLAAGVSVAVGTDSRASNPDLSIWEELRVVAESHPSLSTSTVLELGTLRAAQALGYGDEFGSLENGKAARLITIPIRSSGPGALEQLWDSTATPVCSDIPRRMY